MVSPEKIVQPDSDRSSLLQQAQKCYGAGDLSGAAELLQQAVSTGARDLNTIKNLILILEKLGKMNVAVTYCEHALAAASADAGTYLGLADLFAGHGCLEAAAQLYRRVVRLKADHLPALINLGQVEQQLERFEAANDCYEKALRLDPANADLYYRQGNAHSRQKEYGAAIASYEKALVLAPDHWQALFNMGNACKALGEAEDAIDAYERCLAIRPGDADAHYNLANARYGAGQMQLAIDAYEDVLRLQPHNVSAMNNLGCLLVDLNADDQAASLFLRAIETDPEDAAAHINLGNLYKEQNLPDKALTLLDRARQLDPTNQEALVSMGSLLKKKGRFDEAMACYKEAVAASPEVTNAWWFYHLALPILYETESEIDDHRRRLAQGIDTLIESVPLTTPAQKQRALAGCGCTTNFYLQYQGRNDLALQKRYGAFMHRVMTANFPHYAQRPLMPSLEDGQKIRIGYVSSFMRSHTVGHFLLGWIANHDRSRFEIHGYYIDRPTDPLTDALAAQCDHFHQIPGNLGAAAARIAGDDLHILVFTDIGMFAPATQLAALYLAPVQCKGWGHPVTTGLPTMDYYLTADLMEIDEAQEHYSETLIRLPNLALAFDEPPLPSDRKGRADFKLPNDGFLYLTSQSLFKYLPQHDEIYPRIAQAVPDARFVFIANPSAGITQLFQKRLAAAFARYDIEMEQTCIFQPRLSPDDFLRLNQLCDVLLDPISWSGGKTTLEGISCGLPVVTCPGRFMRQRHAGAMLTRMGITETLTEDMEDYVAIASRLGRDAGYYGRMQSRMTERRHRLYKDTSFIKELENFYGQTVQERLAGKK